MEARGMSDARPMPSDGRLQTLVCRALNRMQDTSLLTATASDSSPPFIILASAVWKLKSLLLTFRP